MEKEIKFLRAIATLTKGKRVVYSHEAEGDNFKITTWDTNNSGAVQPTEEEIQVEIDRYQAEYDALAWKRSRQEEYPLTTECVHAILDDDLTALQEKRQAVKTKWPKDNSGPV